MSDEEWLAVRQRWKEKVKNGDLKCDDNMIPALVGQDGVPYGWVSRQYLETMQEWCSRPEFKASVARAKRFLGKSKKMSK